MTPQAFAIRMQQIAKDIPINLTRGRVQVAKAVLRGVVHRTPVDTSLHGSRWQVSLGVPGRAEYPAFVEGKHGSTRVESFEIAISKGEAQANLLIGDMPLYISNTGPAIRRLNEGYSKQAPANFVEAEIARAIKLLRSIKVLRRT